MITILPARDIKNVLSEGVREQEMGKDAQDRVIRVINGYGKRDGCVDSFCGVVYRIWNTVKAIFGQSDWQKAHKLLEKIVWQMCDDYLETDKWCEDLEGDRLKKAHQLFDKYVDEVATNILKINVEATWERVGSFEEFGRIYRERIRGCTDHPNSEFLSGVSKLGPPFSE